MSKPSQKESLIDACVSFSTGNLKAALNFLSEGVELHFVGRKTFSGLAEIKAVCDAMAPNQGETYEITDKISSKNKVVLQGTCSPVEGNSSEPIFYFCDVYRLGDGCVESIHSYVMEPVPEDAEKE